MRTLLHTADVGPNVVGLILRRARAFNAWPLPEAPRWAQRAHGRVLLRPAVPVHGPGLRERGHQHGRVPLSVGPNRSPSARAARWETTPGCSPGTRPLPSLAPSATTS